MPALIFDLDGALTDPYAAISRSYLHALAAIGRDALDEPALRALIGPPIQHVFATLCADASDRNDGIPEALTTLAQTDTLYVCTSKPHVYAVQILAHFGIAHHFAAVYGSELDGTRADKRELPAWLLERESVDPAATTMIGDRCNDIEAAHATGVAPVAVCWGTEGSANSAMPAQRDCLPNRASCLR